MQVALFKESETGCTGLVCLSHPLTPLFAICPKAEVYISMSKPAEASACTQEAANLFPTSHNVLYMRGQIAELRGNIDEAKRWYEEALSINPTHVKTMQRLVIHKTHTSDSYVLPLLCPCVWSLENITNLVLSARCVHRATPLPVP